MSTRSPIRMLAEDIAIALANHDDVLYNGRNFKMLNLAAQQVRLWIGFKMLLRVLEQTHLYVKALMSNPAILDKDVLFSKTLSIYLEFIIPPAPKEKKSASAEKVGLQTSVQNHVPAKVKGEKVKHTIKKEVPKKQPTKTKLPKKQQAHGELVGSRSHQK